MTTDNARDLGGGNFAQKVSIEHDETGGASETLQQILDKAFEAGTAYCMQHYKRNIDSGVNYHWLIKTPNNDTDVYLAFDTDIHLDMDQEFNENPTISDNGIADALVAINRKDALAAQTLVYHAPTVTNDGLELYKDKSDSDSSWVYTRWNIGNAITRIWKLKANEEYLIKVTGLEANCTAAVELLVIEVR